MLRIDFLTLFPEMVLGAMGHSMMKRAEEAGLVTFGAENPRDFTHDKHRTVDDDPYGGGPGMVMKPEPIWAAVESLLKDEGRRPKVEGSRAKDEGRRPKGEGQRANDEGIAIVLPDPTGVLFRQEHAEELSKAERVIFLCGHYEGIDGRIRELLATHTFSLGDFVLTGGELPALVMADAVVRLIPGVLGCEGSLEQDSFNDGLLSAPQFTHPAEFEGLAVPEVLTQGDHEAAARWKRTQALKLTRQNRPDLLWRARLEKGDVDMLSS